MPLISWREALFSVKAFGAAMLALYIAMSLGLTNPSWAMMTAYIVAQPFSSMAMAKARKSAASSVSPRSRKAQYASVMAQVFIA